MDVMDAANTGRITCKDCACWAGVGIGTRKNIRPCLYTFLPHTLTFSIFVCFQIRILVQWHTYNYKWYRELWCITSHWESTAKGEQMQQSCDLGRRGLRTTCPNKQHSSWVLPVISPDRRAGNHASQKEKMAVFSHRCERIYFYTRSAERVLHPGGTWGKGEVALMGLSVPSSWACFTPCEGEEGAKGLSGLWTIGPSPAHWVDLWESSYLWCWEWWNNLLLLGEEGMRIKNSPVSLIKCSPEQETTSDFYQLDDNESSSNLQPNPYCWLAQYWSQARGQVSIIFELSLFHS